MSKLELILLGRFECLLSSGTRVGLAMRKAEVLLAFLALAPGLRHPRERLINLLWSDRGEEQARNSLRQCLSAIRKSLGEAADLVLQIDRTTVCLNAELIDVDVHEFERLATEGDYESLVTAADLYQGEFLEGIAIRDAACQEWLDGERTRFKRQFVEILFNLAETQLVSHDFGNAIRSAERLVEQDPLAEAGWRLLMQSYADNGDRSHALQSFKRCAQILQKELDVDPEAATVEMRDAIAGGRTDRSAANPAAAAPANAPAKLALVHASVDEYSIAVLPFDNLSGNPEQEYFSDGITDSIIMNLALFPGLSVKSRNSSFAFKEQIKSLGEISRELGVDYIVEGSVRRASGRIRVNVQLIESASGNQVWGKRYDADLDNLFELEESLSRSIAATVTGKIESELQRIAIAKGAGDLRAYDLLLAGIYFTNRSTRADILAAIDKLNRCLEIDPGNALAHAELYYCHDTAVMDRWSEDLDRSRRLAEDHIRQAVALGPSLGRVQVPYADYLMFQQSFDEAEVQLARALDTNPNDTEAIATRAIGFSLRGDPESALEQADLALSLDPYHPWARWIRSEALYFCGSYEECLATIADSDNAPGFIQIYTVAANASLGRMDRARRALEDFLQFCRQNMPSLPQDIGAWRAYYRDNAPFADPTTNDRVIDLLVDAGLENAACAEESKDKTESFPSIAVLPFENMSGDPEQEHFADGITTDIIAILSKFRHLRTISRYSTVIYKHGRASISEIAKQQGVRYILDGSVRKSGDRIRVSAELIDSVNGKILWNERFDRDLDDLFAVQDEITRNIALAMKIQFDDGEMARHRAKNAGDIRAWELTLIAVDLQDTYIYRNIIESRKLAQEAIRLDPGYAFAWVVLAWTHFQETFAGWCESFEASIADAGEANRKALEIDPEYGEAWSQAGTIAMIKHEPETMLEACRKAVEIEPGNAEIRILMAISLVFAEAYEEARLHCEEVTRLCPVMPNWYYLAEASIERNKGDLQRAIEIYRKGVDVEPDSPLCRFFLVDAFANTDTESALRCADEIRSLDSMFKGRGLVQSYSVNPELRDRFRVNLEKYDLY